ncbi:hypothetical protein [Streptomyces exfoliatus]|uniref:hypothetical protein n=1 Tax=Streptomyces exfoliatus TaxID=1905 RepID=UPI003C2D4FF9
MTPAARLERVRASAGVVKLAKGGAPGSVLVHRTRATERGVTFYWAKMADSTETAARTASCTATAVTAATWSKSPTNGTAGTAAR